MTTPINELELQRCVDGELPALERRVFLERIEATPDGWKTVALAFVENQDFDSASAEFRQGDLATPVMTAARNPDPRRRSTGQVVQSLALAASLAAAFWTGRQAGRPALQNPAEDSREIVSSSGPSAQSIATTGQARSVMKPAAVLELPFQGAESEPLAIPVYDGQSLADEGPEIPLWPDISRKNALSRPGYRVTSQRNLISIPLSSGGAVLVPVEVSGVRYAVQ